MNTDKHTNTITQKVTNFDCLLLHGLAQSNNALLPIKEKLEELTPSCFCPKLIAHRNNLPKDNEVKYHNWLLELETHLKYITFDYTKEIIVVGHSFGCLLGLYAAIKHPKNIKGLILLSPSIELRNTLFDNLISLLQFVPDLIVQNLPNIKKETITSKHKGSNEYYSLNLLKHLGKLRSEVFKDLHTVNKPIYTIQSTNDYHISKSASHKLQGLMPNSNFKIVLQDFGNNHNLANVPEIQKYFERAISHVCQEN